MRFVRQTDSDHDYGHSHCDSMISTSPRPKGTGERHGDGVVPTNSGGPDEIGAVSKRQRMRQRVSE